MIDAMQKEDIMCAIKGDLSTKESKAFRFRLWTGQSYLIEFRYEREHCPWECLCYGISPIESCIYYFDYPYGFLPYPDSTPPYDASNYRHYRCGFHTNDCSWPAFSTIQKIVTIPTMPFEILDIPRIPQSIPTSNDCVLSRSIQNQPSLINWRPGWDMSYNIYLEHIFDPNALDGIDEEKIYLYPGDGNMYLYLPDSHPVYGAVWTCSKRDDVLKEWANGTYTLYQKQNRYWQFNDKGYIEYISENDQAITFGYDPNTYGINDTLKLEYIEDNCGRKTTLVYTEPNGFYPGNLLKIIDYTGREWTYDYYIDGNLKTVTDPNGFMETYEYDDWCRLTVIKDHDNNEWLTNKYDYQGRVYQQALGDPNGPVSTITYNLSNSVVTDANGIDTTYILNDDGYGLSKTVETEAGSVTTLYQRNAQNKLTQVLYPEQNGYDLVYDPNTDNLISVACPVQKYIRASN